MNEKIAATKNFVRRHKTALAVAATATVATVIHCKIVGEWNEFLDTHGLTDLYYHPEEI